MTKKYFIAFCRLAIKILFMLDLLNINGFCTGTMNI